MKSFYITTAIDYANGSPHLGHAYEKVLTDVIARYQRIRGNDVRFLTGLDEHGQKVQQSAEREGIEPQDYVDRVSVEFVDLCRDLNISNDEFIRTTQPHHKAVVTDLLQKIHEKGEIYRDEYKGFYSVRAEQFVLEREKDEDGNWPEVYGEVVEIVEANYFFRLSKYQDWLIDYIQQNEAFILPRYRAKQVLEFLKEPINDLCISRPKERLAWGIELPFDSDYVTYVWFDALINYVTGAFYGEEQFATYWPADMHVIGKDILAPAHAVYWPIMLKALDLPMPRTILAHGWWLTRGKKYSKSDAESLAAAATEPKPLDLIKLFGPDAFRYFVMREMNVGQDSDYSYDLFMARYNSELANDLGNLINRLLNMGGRYCGGTIPPATIDDEPEQALRNHWAALSGELPGLFDGMQFHLGLEKIFAFITALNRYFEIRQPWKLAKADTEENKALVATSIATVAEGLRLAATVLAPVMPGTSKIALEKVGEIEAPLWEGNLQWSAGRLTGNALGDRVILFPKPPRE